MCRLWARFMNTLSNPTETDMCKIVFYRDPVYQLLKVLYYDDYATAQDFADALAAIKPARLTCVDMVITAFNGRPVLNSSYPKRWQDATLRQQFDNAFHSALSH